MPEAGAGAAATTAARACRSARAAEQEPTSSVTEGGLNGQTSSCGALRTGDGSRYNRCRSRVLQKPILGATDGECGHCLGVRSFLFEILQTIMTVTEADGQFQAAACVNRIIGGVPGS